MLPKLLANENFPLASVYQLRKSGYDITSITEQSQGMSDVQVLEKAFTEQRTILTFDRDYGELIYKKHLVCTSGIVYFRMIPYDPLEPAQLFLDIVHAQDIIFVGSFTILERTQIRQKPLP